MTDRVLVLGEAPGPANDGRGPLGGPGGARLRKLAGTAAYRLDGENLLDDWPGAAGKGSRFPVERARDRVVDPLFVEKLHEYDRVVVLGRRVWRALGLPNSTPWLAWAYPVRGPLAGIDFTLFPHPSGVNRWWNAPENVERARRTLRDVLDGDPAFPDDRKPGEPPADRTAAPKPWGDVMKRTR